MQRFDLADLVPGTEARGAVCVRSREERQTRDGKPYLVVQLGNATGASTARIWSERLPDWEGVRAGDAVDIHARVQSGWRGGPPELDVVEVVPLPATHPIRLELNPQGPRSRAELEPRFDELAASIRSVRTRRLVDVVISHVGRDPFFTAPAAVKHHHAYVSGLAEHSIEVTDLALAIAAVDPFASAVERDALVAGALLHDVGKVVEYAWEGVPISVSRAGRLRSHVCRGAEIIGLATRWAVEAGTVSRLDVEHLQHVILSHHGQPDWGSPTAPCTLEAMIIHHADLASARLRPVADLLLDGNGDEEHWIESRGWKNPAVWAFRRARSENRRDPVNSEGDQARIEKPQVETAAYIFLPEEVSDV